MSIKKTSLWILRILPVLVLLAGSLAVYALFQSAPIAERKPRLQQARLVEVITAQNHPQTVQITAWGTVMPARRISLRAQVSGQVKTASPDFVPGGRFQQGDVLLEIEDADYVFQVQQRESDLAKAQAELEMEQGNQFIAQTEFGLLKEPVSEVQQRLMLRKPQLAAAKAQAASARAALEAAKLALARTRITAPFDAVILERQVTQGSFITNNTEIAALAGVNAYWVELSLPVADLRWIKVPEKPEDTGSPVRIHDQFAWQPGAFRTGEVIQLLSELDSKGRMARLLVEVKAPLKAQSPELLLGAYVRAEIEGIELEHVFQIPRNLLRENDRVWIMNAEDQLEIRPVTVSYRGEEAVLIREGLKAGERIVATEFATATQGMPLRVSQ